MNGYMNNGNKDYLREFKNMQRLGLTVLLLASVLIFGSSPSWAVPIETNGTTMFAIDGNADGNVTVNALSLGLTIPNYTAGYFLNGDYSTFYTLTFGVIGVDTFQGGAVIDLALQNNMTSEFLTASQDPYDSSYAVTMDWSGVVCCAQQPASFSDPYYSNVLVTWSLPGEVVYSDELALNFKNGNDGFAPDPPSAQSVPEPSTILLLGFGLAALGFWSRKRRQPVVVK